ncbi:bifunctional 4-hydroxy-2-oxoglutarate aldolase/2-dehydro-3-deoxy-phosphogluconate aldolase [Sulfuricurvum sp.]|uniref:bifunctional 4-hydroxy-2-oxoglutarate aldolase/2-dehydro-3-deoxy-phosphogluconate aldolase n=1 Tax=Sulfuricurvum sp. TaxID=2025608 RepID=UPI002625B3CE|nr:bifunctional 4-hydroxy-2-oxoglutarate aldolase/2-dehydro-3-deoxy-phosphogluconate aldolase [Sulfuricurvum sp.]MDD2781114.1 bifunctional 4-hydroxy-2-oxoglutarate aldolase/2-dehydro-3-deoxy-phosphogluconate aldolase [Sulfuricurvum sp.]
MNSYDVMNISPIVPVIAIDNADDALSLAEALLEGGVGLMEITLRTEAGLRAIEIIAKEYPQMAVGAGTVINRAGFKSAVDHGAQFVFSPGINQEIMDASSELNTPLILGVATASEVMFALNNGFEYCKLFPATAVGGVDTLNALYGPFPSMRFCPTGGINFNNINDFLKLPNVLCAGGSWIVPKQSLHVKDFKHITHLCNEAIAHIHNNR